MFMVALLISAFMVSLMVCNFQKYEEEKRRIAQQSQNITEENELHSENKEKEEQKEEHIPVTA